MDRPVKQAVAVLLLLAGPPVIGMVTADQAADVGGADPSTPIATLLEKQPVGEDVDVTGTVTSQLENYTARSGNRYQQFRISDGSGEILVFCSTRNGRTDVAVDDRVRVTGTFKEFHGTLEIYTSCTAVEPVGSSVTTR